MNSSAVVVHPVPEGRFEFGKNWSRFLGVLNGDRISEAEYSLRTMLEVEDLCGKSFLDAGSGSGLFSLAARRLGARVHSFDDDPQAVACAAELRRRYFHQDSDWKIERGSVLDMNFLKSLGQFDILYCWGVLHHTGAMWKAIENVALPVFPGGRLFISIYNDQGVRSKAWRLVKKTYNSLPSVFRLPFALLVMLPREALGFFAAAATAKPWMYIRSWTEYYKSRGMSRWHDLIDWVGGYPFEVAKPEEVLDFYRKRGFILIKLKTCGGGLGCNEYVFEKMRGDRP